MPLLHLIECLSLVYEDLQESHDILVEGEEVEGDGVEDKTRRITLYSEHHPSIAFMNQMCVLCVCVCVCVCVCASCFYSHLG